MTGSLFNRGPARAALLPVLVSTLAVTACQTSAERPADGPVPEPPATTSGAPVESYVEALDGMAAGDPVRQQATLSSARSAWQEAPTPANTLRYALVLGTPGHDDTNPLEASRLLASLLAAPDLLSRDERLLASAFQREFTARVSQYADLARARLESDARMRATETEAKSRIDAMAADLARVRRERDTIQQKLDAIADIERSLMERDGEATAAPDSTQP